MKLLVLEKSVGSNPGDFPYDITTYGSLGTNEGGNLKELCLTHWTNPNTGATNSSGFTGLPGGNCWVGTFSYFGTNGYFWCSTETGPFNAIYRYLSYGDAKVYVTLAGKGYGISIRCVKD